MLTFSQALALPYTLSICLFHLIEIHFIVYLCNIYLSIYIIDI